MITCANCETPQFLQIVQSRIYYDDGVAELMEKYQCTMCRSTGEYVYEQTGETGYHSLRGEIEEIDERPKAEI